MDAYQGSPVYSYKIELENRRTVSLANPKTDALDRMVLSIKLNMYVTKSKGIIAKSILRKMRLAEVESMPARSVAAASEVSGDMMLLMGPDLEQPNAGHDAFLSGIPLTSSQEITDHKIGEPRGTWVSDKHGLSTTDNSKHPDS